MAHVWHSAVRSQRSGQLHASDAGHAADMFSWRRACMILSAHRVAPGGCGGQPSQPQSCALQRPLLATCGLQQDEECKPPAVSCQLAAACCTSDSASGPGATSWMPRTRTCMANARTCEVLAIPRAVQCMTRFAADHQTVSRLTQGSQGLAAAWKTGLQPLVCRPACRSVV